MRTETAAATMNDTRPLAETCRVINESTTFSPGTDSSIENQRADKGYVGDRFCVDARGDEEKPAEFELTHWIHTDVTFLAAVG